MQVRRAYGPSQRKLTVLSLMVHVRRVKQNRKVCARGKRYYTIFNVSFDSPKAFHDHKTCCAHRALPENKKTRPNSALCTLALSDMIVTCKEQLSLGSSEYAIFQIKSYFVL